MHRRPGILTTRPSAMLIDQWMPAFDASEKHETRIRAPRSVVWAQVRRLDFGRPLVIRALMALRMLPSLFTRAGREKARQGMEGGLLRAGFVLLDERVEDELLLGVAGKFWRPSGNIERVTADDLRGFDRPGYAVATWNFALRDDGDGTVLVTETRVRCTDGASRRSFLRYWRIVGPFSALIRVELLRSIRRAAEARSAAALSLTGSR
ncbi:MAG TPA: hypothetical protein VFS20_31155 [Longimicrobium sp.]|nr:hypothetical protein [Longimicrobium sp.]